MEHYLPFEKPIVELMHQIESLRNTSSNHIDGVDVLEEVQRLEAKAKSLKERIYANLTPWQITQIARHAERPHTLDYVETLFDNFTELHGDRHFADDPAIVAGIGRFMGRSVAFIGQEKGRDLEERLKRNFGMPRPEGYRKAQRIMELAQRFKLPLITLIDTPGAYPGIDAEERGQSEAIAKNLQVMSRLKTPIVSCIIGEGGSGGALGIGVCDTLLMLEYSTYSVISPEGCASILWKKADAAEKAAEAMQITAKQLDAHGLVDVVVSEPEGGAHKSPDIVFSNLKSSLDNALKNIHEKDEALIEKRYMRLKQYVSLNG